MARISAVTRKLAGSIPASHSFLWAGRYLCPHFADEAEVVQALDL